MNEQKEILNEYAKDVLNYYKNEEVPNIWYPMFHGRPQDERKNQRWVNENFDKFLKETRNEILYNRWFCSELGAITALTYAPSGSHIIVGHASGLIQVWSSYQHSTHMRLGTATKMPLRILVFTAFFQE